MAASGSSDLAAPSGGGVGVIDEIAPKTYKDCKDVVGSGVARQSLSDVPHRGHVAISTLSDGSTMVVHLSTLEKHTIRRPGSWRLWYDGDGFA